MVFTFSLSSGWGFVFNSNVPDKKTETPMMRQYALIHQKLPENTILFFRLGDFYEMFFGDAETCARILGLTLTQRNGMPMAGIPFHASETYIDKLLKAGKKVAICDQMEEPKPGKLVDRALTRILTPGTVLEDAQIEASSNQYIVCVDQQSELLCAAWMDLSTSEFKIASESDIDSLISFLISLNPKEIVISESLTSEQRNRLTYLLQNRAVSTVPSYLFNAVNARSHLEQLFEVQHLDGFGLTTDEPALSCADALVFYITENLCHSPKNLKKLTRYHCKKALLMDSATAQNLEIFQTQRGTREGSLWQFLDVAKTAAGSRLIQRFLISPLIDLEEITYRQNCIEAFYKASMATHALQSYLPRTRDITRILARLHNRLRSPRELGAILTTLQQLPAIQTLVNQIPSDELRALAQKIQLFDELKTLLQSALNDDLPNDLLAGGYIRSGYDPTLDHLRSAQQESQEWLQRFEEREQQSTGIRNLRVKYNAAIGYFIEVSKSNVSLVPLHYIRKKTLTHYERYSTEALKAKEDFILHSRERALEKERELFIELIDAVLVQSDALQKTADVLAHLDVFSAWSTLARIGNYCRPVVDNSTVFEIEAGRHPIVETALRSSIEPVDFTTNDLSLDCTQHQIMVLTGPNMAGKSTFIRQNAIIALMAHIGCWVPATHCHLGWVDRICSRVGANDNLANGQSTFMVEMLETAAILNNATNRTFIVLDEIGRGTGTDDGLSIAQAVIEFLHQDQEQGPRTLFATHYHELKQLAEIYPRIFNMHVTVKEWEDKIIFMHHICPGSSSRSYGIQVAKLAGLPEWVIERAKVLLAHLEQHREHTDSLLCQASNNGND